MRGVFETQKNGVCGLNSSKITKTTFPKINKIASKKLANVGFIKLTIYRENIDEKLSYIF